jgi:hypothetical protein
MDRIRSSVPLAWVIATVGFAISSFLGQSVAGPAATVLAAVLSGLIAGAVIGLAQGLALGFRARALAIWVGGTAAALAVGLGAVTAAIGQIETTGEAVALGAVSGLAIGAVQAAVFMRGGVPNAWLWVPVTGIAWAAGWLITAGIGVALTPGWPVYGTSGALVSQIITAVALWRLVDSRESLRVAA